MTTSVLPSPPAAPSAPPPATAPQAGPPARPDPPRRLRLRTVPGRIRAWTAAAVVALLALFGLATMAISDARAGLDVLGEHGAGRQVVTTANLYYALSDMDTQVANLLLIGGERLGGAREEAEKRYEQSRAQASEALLQAARLADDETERETVRSLLTKLGEYERLAERARQLNDQDGHTAGRPENPEVLRQYREATELMRLELLPQAYNATLDSGVLVRRTYEEQHAAVQTGRLAVAAAGLATLVALVGLQVYLAHRFRRILNPALLAATVVVTVLVGMVMGLLDREAANLRTAKQDGFDSVLALKRAQAISNSLHGDQSRYLLDPDAADTYEQVYLDKSQRVLHTDAGNLKKYYASLRTVRQEYPGKVTFLGLLGDEANNARTKAHRDALAETLKRYEIFQQTDDRLRQMNPSNPSNQPQADPSQVAQSQTGRPRADLSQVVRFRMGEVARAFDEYDKSLMALADSHERTLRAAIKSGEDALGGWDYRLPGAVLAAAVLIFVGVRPRLQEYR